MKKFGIVLITIGVLYVLISIPIALNVSALSGICVFLFNAGLIVGGIFLIKKANEKDKIAIAEGKEVKPVSAVNVVVITFAVILGIAFVAGNLTRLYLSKKDAKKSDFYSQKTINEKTDCLKQIEQSDKNCPIELAAGTGRITHIKLENQYVTYYIEYKSGYFDFNFWKIKENTEIFKEGMFCAFFMIDAQGPDNGSNFMDCLIEKGYGIRFIISSIDNELANNNDFRISMHSYEISQMKKESEMNPSEAYYKYLNMRVLCDRTSLPQKIDDTMVLSNIELEDRSIVYTIKVDEDYYGDVRILDDVQLKLDFFDSLLEDEETLVQLTLCKVSHTGYIYNFVGTKTRRSVKYEYSSDFIARKVKTPSNLNIR